MKFIFILLIFLLSCSTGSKLTEEKENVLVLKPGVSVKVPMSNLEVKIVSLNKYLFSKDKSGKWKSTDVVRFEAKIDGIVSQEDVDEHKSEAIIGEYSFNLIQVSPPLSFEDEEESTIEVDRKVILAFNKVPQ